MDKDKVLMASTQDQRHRGSFRGQVLPFDARQIAKGTSGFPHSGTGGRRRRPGTNTRKSKPQAQQVPVQIQPRRTCKANGDVRDDFSMISCLRRWRSLEITQHSPESHDWVTADNWCRVGFVPQTSVFLLPRLLLPRHATLLPPPLSCPHHVGKIRSLVAVQHPAPLVEAYLKVEVLQHFDRFGMDEKLLLLLLPAFSSGLRCTSRYEAKILLGTVAGRGLLQLLPRRSPSLHAQSITRAVVTKNEASSYRGHNHGDP